MTKQETIKLLTAIYNMFPKEKAFDMSIKKDVDAIGMIEIWGSMLDDIKYNDAMNALQAHASRSNFSPSIHEIRATVLEIQSKSDGKITADEAWNLECFDYRRKKIREWIKAKGNAAGEGVRVRKDFVFY